MEAKPVENYTRSNYFTEEEISQFANDLILDEKQILLINEPTPESEIEYKEDEHGRKYKSVRAAYVKRRVNLIFGFNYVFKILDREHIKESNEVLVHGSLIVNGTSREQFGRHSLVPRNAKTQKSNTVIYSGLGNAFKSAATDAFKKCASEFGICWDVYDQELPEPEEIKNPHGLSQDEIKTHERLDYFLQIQKDKSGIDEIFEKWEKENESIPYTKDLLSKHLNRINSKK